MFCNKRKNINYLQKYLKNKKIISKIIKAREQIFHQKQIVEVNKTKSSEKSS